MSFQGLQDRVVIVTGGGSGIGRATARRLVTEGARVAVVDIDGAAARATAEELEPERALALEGDVSSERDVTRYFGEAAEHFGRVDALHNNAAVEGPLCEVVDFELSEYQRLLRVNCEGVFLNLRQMLRTAREQKAAATIVNTASVAGARAVPSLGAYGSTKGAIIALTRAAAIECAGSGTRVNAVVPGPVETALLERLPADFRKQSAEFVPQGRVGTAEEIAALVTFLLSDEAPFMTGGTYTIDGGQSA